MGRPPRFSTGQSFPEDSKLQGEPVGRVGNASRSPCGPAARRDTAPAFSKSWGNRSGRSGPSRSGRHGRRDFPRTALSIGLEAAPTAVSRGPRGRPAAAVWGAARGGLHKASSREPVPKQNGELGTAVPGTRIPAAAATSARSSAASGRSASPPPGRSESGPAFAPHAAPCCSGSRSRSSYRSPAGSASKTRRTGSPASSSAASSARSPGTSGTQELASNPSSSLLRLPPACPPGRSDAAPTANSFRSFQDACASEYRIRCTTQVCTVASGNAASIALRKPLQPVHHRNQHIPNAPRLQLVHHPQPELRTPRSPPSTSPKSPSAPAP